MRALEFWILGPLEVRADGEPLALGGPKQRALLAILLLSANRVVSRERLIEELWPERGVSGAESALRVSVGRLRKALGDDASRDPRLVTRPPGYLVRVGPGELDLDHFESLVGAGRRALGVGDVGHAVSLLRAADALWRGRPLADLEFEPFARLDIDRLEELRLAAIEDRIDAELAVGHHAGLIAELEVLAAEHPLRERMRAQLMLALYRSGRQAEALAAYRTTRRMLVQELGLDPGPQLQELERAILQQHERLDLRPPAAALAETEPSAELSEPPVRGRRRSLLAAVVVGCALVAAVVALAPRRGTIRAPHSDALLSLTNDGIAASVPLRSPATRVTAGFGSIWVSQFDTGTVTRVDVGGGGVRQTVRVGSGPGGITTGAGAVWVANTLDGTISRIDPTTDDVVQTTAVGGLPTDVAVSGGTVWVASAGTDRLTSLDARSGAIVRRVGVGAVPTALAADAAGLWLSSDEGRSVSRLDSHTLSVTATVGVGGGASAIAIGAGAVWVVNSLDGTVSKIDPGRDVVTATIGVGNDPAAVAVSGNRVWVANESDGTVSRIDPSTNRVTATIAAGDEPAALASAAGRVWVGARARGANHRGGQLVLLNQSRAFDSIDPAISRELFPTALLGMTNDGLVTFKHVDGSEGTDVVPDLAASLPLPSDAGRSYTFRLRPRIRYSTGAPLRAGDFRHALERVFRQRSPGSGFYTAILGAGQCMREPQRCDLSHGVVANDRAGTVTIHLRTPDPELLYKLALPFADAVPEDTPTGTIGTSPLPATGPYRIATYRPGRELTLVRNPSFREWSRAAQPDGYPDTIVWKLGVGAEASVDAIEHDRADWMLDFGALPADRRDEVAIRFAAQLHAHNTLATDYFTLNVRGPPFNDARAREAVNFAIDRRAVVRLYGGPSEATPTCQVLPPQMPGYRRYCPYTTGPTRGGVWRAPDIARARRLVAASGTSGQRVVVLDSPTPKIFADEGRIAVSALRRIGYRAELKLIPDDVFVRVAGDPSKVFSNIESGGWAADYPAPSNFIELKLSCAAIHRNSANNPNSGGFCNPGLDRLMQRARTLQVSDPTTANELWARIDRALVDHGAWLPLVTPTNTDLVSKRVGNYRYHPLWGPLIDQLWVR